VAGKRGTENNFNFIFSRENLTGKTLLKNVTSVK
jgi:hypothetical protein